MRSVFLVLLLVGSAHGLFGTISNIVGGVTNTLTAVTNTIGQTASNLWNGATGAVGNVVGNVVDSAGNVYGQLVNTANGVQFASNFLWDNVFGPAYGMFVEGGQLFLDDKFGNLVSVVGRRSVLPENILTSKYVELTSQLKDKLHTLFNELFEMEKEALLSLQKGEKNFEETIRAFYDRISSNEKQIFDWAIEAKYQLETYAKTLQGDYVHALQQFSQNIDAAAKNMRTMFERLTHDLLKTYVELASKIIADASAVINNLKQQGLLSFLQ